MSESDSSYPIVLFDGVCNLCNTSVRFLLAYNRKENLRFLPLQSVKAKEILNKLNRGTDVMGTLILIENENVYTKSEAVFRLSNELVYPWKAIYHFRHLPQGFCDWLYDLISQNRYNWFGKKASCMRPKPEWEDRFL